MIRNAFYNLFLKELHNLYSGEKQQIAAIPSLIVGATTPDLKEAFQRHMQETIEHKKRLEQIYGQIGEPPSTGNDCQVMKHLIEEANEVIKANFPDKVKDAALIGVAQCIEHIEIAQYGITKRFADLLELHEAVELLQECSDEEGKFDKSLSSLAEGSFFSTGLNKLAFKEA
jgi:ferritin-like metal-binding protein YciE